MKCLVVLLAFVCSDIVCHARRMHLAASAMHDGQPSQELATSIAPLHSLRNLALQFTARNPSAAVLETTKKALKRSIGKSGHGRRSPLREQVLCRLVDSGINVNANDRSRTHVVQLQEGNDGLQYKDLVPSLEQERLDAVLTEEDCERLLDMVCSSSDSDLVGMGFEPLTAGFANHVWAMKTKGHHVVVKCYTDLAFLRLDPDAMGSVDVAVGNSAIGPCVRYSSPRGLVMDHVDGHTLEEKEMHKDDFGLLGTLANAVAQLHRLPIPEVCKGDPMLWRSVDKTVAVANEKPELWPAGMPSIESVMKEIRWAKEMVDKISPEIVLAHGDLKPSNVISDEKKNEVHIIDCELGGPNYRAYDLMKIFRTAADASETSMRYFFRKYSEEIDGSTSERSIDRLFAEAKLFEPLTWLEASCFFLAMPQFKPEDTSNWHHLAVDRWKKYQETKHMLLDSV